MAPQTMSSNKDNSKLTYNSYLKVSELISLQVPLSNPVAHDELLFIVIHQVYELWFKLISFELTGIIAHVPRDHWLQVFHSLERICEILKVLVQQLDILETMTPIEFNRFREHLNPASGFQSLQFREVELLSGADKNAYDKLKVFEPEWVENLKKRPETPNLRTVFLDVLKRHKKATTPEQVEKAIQEIYGEEPRSALQTLCEFLIRYDELILLWRFRHVQMVERMIGMKKGTGGSLGVPYLQSTLNKRFFPELWQARTAMGGEYGTV